LSSRSIVCIQQASFFLFSAAAIGLSLYLVGYSFDEASQGEFVFSIFGLQAVSAVVLGLSGFLSFVNVRLAAKLAFISAMVAEAIFAIRLCFSLAFAASFLLLPITWGYFFPIVVLPLTIAYARRVMTESSPPVTVLSWLQAPRPARRVLVVLAVVIAVLSISYAAFADAIISTNTEFYRIRLQDDSTETRPQSVRLVFVDYECYELFASSQSLHDYAVATQDTILEIVLDRHRTIGGVWIYEVQRVGEWDGTAEFHGPQLVMRSSNQQCHPGSPIRSPYRFRLKQGE
jgi:hypothetical protein